MRRLALVCGVVLLVAAIVASLAQGQDGGAVIHTSPPAPQPWHLKRGVALTPASRSLTITFYAGGCIQDAGTAVQETADAVTITTYVTSFSGFDGPYPISVPCPMAVLRARRLTLDAPLGNRVILDGSSQPPLERYPGRRAPWRLIGVARDQRHLRLAYEGGGCLENDGRAVATETRRAIRIVVHQTVDVPPGPYGVCTTELRNLRTTVALRHPVGGRAVRGGPPFPRARPLDDRLPRVVGLRRHDAAALLRWAALHVRGPRHGTVVAQRPRAGHHVAFGATVRLRTR